MQSSLQQKASELSGEELGAAFLGLPRGFTSQSSPQGTGDAENWARTLLCTGFTSAVRFPYSSAVSSKILP